MRPPGVLPPILFGLCLLSSIDCECFFGDAGGENVVSPTTAQKNSPECKGTYAAKEGCSLRMKCKQGTETSPGYYFETDTRGEGIQMTCRGDIWRSEGGGTKLPPCKQGCIVLSSKMMENATYVGGAPAKTYRNGDQIYWAENTEIKTQCKPGFVFTNINLEKAGQDHHRCTGSVGSGWRDLINNLGYGWPAQCRAVCKPIDPRDIPTGVEQVNNPANDPNSFRDMPDGSRVMMPNTAYQFKCKPGYKYLPPHDRTDKQTIQCIGGVGQWLDPATGKSNAKIAECVSNGCPAISANNIDQNANVETGSGCSMSGGTRPENCQLTINCNKNAGSPTGLGYFLPDKPSGMKLVCKEGNWVDENGRKVTPDSTGKYGGRCEAGCAGLTASQMVKAKVLKDPTRQSNRNDDLEFYSVGATMETACNENYIRPGVENQPPSGDIFRCEETGWKNTNGGQSGSAGNHPATCVPACRVPEPVPEGTKISLNGMKTKKGKEAFVQEGATVAVDCADKFIAPTGTGPSQQLQCIGGSQGWKNSKTEASNEVIMTCVRDGAKGCPVVSPQSQPNTEVESNAQCQPIDGLVQEGCQISIKCRSGYIPEKSTMETSADGSQKITCRAGHDGYVDDTSGAKNVPVLKCVGGCEVVRSMETAEYTKPPTESDVVKYMGKEYVPKGSEMTIKCKPNGFALYDSRDMDRGPEVPYQCNGGEERYMKSLTGVFNKMPGDACGGVCKSLLGTVPAGTLLREMDGEFASYTEAGVRMVVNMKYQASCDKGFEYPKGTPEAERGNQNLHCIGADDAYVDTDTNKTKATPTLCIKSEEPRCPAIDTSSTGTVIEASEGNCTVSSAKTSVGCTQTLTCKSGFFPSTVVTGTTVKKTVKCAIQNNGEAVWVDVQTNLPASELKCEFGCPVVDPGPNANIYSEPQAKLNGAVAYHKEGTVVSITCKPGYLSPSPLGTIADNREPISYTCSNMVKDRPWKNNIAQQYEDYPGSSCMKTCTPLYANGDGLVMSVGPQEKATTGGQTVVLGGGIYTFECMKGYHYPNETGNTNQDNQQIYCNPNRGEYHDLTNNNATLNSPKLCKKNEGPGCSDVQRSNEVEMTTEGCASGYVAGCAITMKCKEGYIPSDPSLHATGSQRLTCPDGNDWVDSEGKKTNNGMMCEPACRLDSDKVNPRATISNNFTRTVDVNNVVYMRPGDYVAIQCKGDGVVWEQKVSETKNKQEFTCRGGEEGFQRASDSKLNVVIGEGCVDTCKTFSLTVPDTVNVKAPPSITYNGEDLVANKDTYEFTCKKDFIYPEGSSAAVSGHQTFSCDGKTRQYVDTKTGAAVTSVQGCKRNPQLNECPMLSANYSQVTESAPDCTIVADQYYGSGCVIRYKCKTGFMPTSPAYQSGSGEQVLTCTSGGAGWRDQHGQKMDAAMTCIGGCVPQNEVSQTNQQTTTATLEGVTVSCRDIDISSNTSTSQNPYSCPPTQSNYYDSRCENGCRQLFIPLTVEVVNKPVSIPNVNDYIFGTHQYVLKCGKGFMYPEGIFARKTGSQTLRCNGATNQYDDVDTGMKNVSAIECIESVGCTELKQGDFVSQPTQGSNCQKNGDSYNAGCDLTYKCRKGSHPSDDIYLYSESGQTITCGADDQKWKTPEGKEVTDLLTCVAGCAKLEESRIYSLLNATGTVVKMEYVLDTANNKHLCYSSQTKNKIDERRELIYKSGKDYFCGGDSQSGTSTDGPTSSQQACQETCPALPIQKSKLATGVTLKVPPATLNPFGELLVGMNTVFEYSCDIGYEYAAGSAYAKEGKQRLECQGDGGYKDLSTGEKTTKIQACQEIVGCPIPTNKGIEFTSQGCEVNGDVFNVNCELTIKCLAGHYPSTLANQQKGWQTIECKSELGKGVWFEGRARSSPWQCVEGCLDPSTIKATNTSKLTNSFIVSSAPLVEVVCSESASSSNRNIGSDIGPYYCGWTAKDGFGEQTSNIVPCTNSCDMPIVDSSLIIQKDFKGTIADRASRLFKLVIMQTCSLTVSCQSGKVFTDTERNQKRLTCVDGLKLKDDEGNIVTEVKDTCV